MSSQTELWVVLSILNCIGGLAILFTVIHVLAWISQHDKEGGD